MDAKQSELNPGALEFLSLDEEDLARYNEATIDAVILIAQSIA